MAGTEEQNSTASCYQQDHPTTVLFVLGTLIASALGAVPLFAKATPFALAVTVERFTVLILTNVFLPAETNAVGLVCFLAAVVLVFQTSVHGGLDTVPFFAIVLLRGCIEATASGRVSRGRSATITITDAKPDSLLVANPERAIETALVATDATTPLRVSSRPSRAKRRVVIETTVFSFGHRPTRTVLLQECWNLAVRRVPTWFVLCVFPGKGPPDTDSRPPTRRDSEERREHENR